MASIRPRRGRWQVVVEEGRDPMTGRRHQRTHLFPTLEEAEVFVEDVLGQPVRRREVDDGQAERAPDDVLLPVEPLVEHAGGVSQLARIVGTSRRSVQRAGRSGLRVWKADRWACALGLHPSEVWGHAWWSAADTAA